MENKNVVKYKNNFNAVALKDFTGTEIDMLFALLSKLKEQDTEIVELHFNKLKKMIYYNPKKTNTVFVSELKEMLTKIFSLQIGIEEEENYTQFTLFSKFEVDKENKIITIQINSDFAYLFNEFADQFTRFELEELVSLNSKYSKNLYRQLKQFKATGVRIFKIEDFRERMDIPETYNMSNITQRVLEPTKEELGQYFKNLDYEKIKGDDIDYRKVTHIKFTFKPEKVKKEKEEREKDKEESNSVKNSSKKTIITVTVSEEKLNGR